MKIGKVTESEMVHRLKVGETILAPLVIQACKLNISKSGADAYIEIALPNESQGYCFAVEVQGRSTPQMVEYAMIKAKMAATDGMLPMICIPHLSSARLAELEKAGVSGVDMCGNGIVIVPDRLFVIRAGQPNLYRDSRPLSNPYRGRSAMAARMLLMRPKWETLTAMTEAIQAAGEMLSLPQASKAVHALVEERIVSKSAGKISLREPSRLLDKLGRNWSKPLILRSQTLRLPPETDIVKALSANPNLRWAVTGESSVTRYATFSQGGPRRIVVSNLPEAMALIGGEIENVPSFATDELIETHEAGFYFANEVDQKGVRWASPLQTWLELQSGDARQRDAAQGLRGQILMKAQFDHEQ